MCTPTCTQRYKHVYVPPLRGTYRTRARIGSSPSLPVVPGGEITGSKVGRPRLDSDIRLRRSSLLLWLPKISGNRRTDSNLEEKSTKK